MAILFCRLIFVALAIKNTVADDISYNRRAKNPDVNVQWFYENGAEYIYFKMHSPFSTGWVGVGFNDKSSMIGEDCVVGWVDENGKGHLEDRHALENWEPKLDERQDYTLTAAKIQNGTTIEFKRKIKNCDENDYKFLQGHTYLLFVFCEEYPIMENGKFSLPYHKTNHFSSKEIILNAAAALDERLEQPEDTTDTFDIEFKNFIIPKKKTTYWCQVFEIDDKYKNADHYYIGYKPMLTRGKEKYFHHGAIGQCRQNPEKWAAKVKEGGFDCTSMEKFIEFAGCYPAIVTFVIGSPGEYYPSDIAFPFGERVGGSNYLYFQAHFTNEDLEEDIAASSKIRMYLTTHKRTNIAGTLGSLSSTDYTLAIPPKQPKFGYSVICPTKCLDFFPEEGVTIFAILPHMHQTGRYIRIRHFNKNGIELKPIYEDTNYIFDSQESYLLPERIKLNKGDSISTECFFNTMSRTETVLGGLSTFEEMCVGGLFFYPIQPNISACSFSLLKNEEAGFFGITKFDPNTDLIIEPSSLKEKTVENVIRTYEWNDEKVKQFQDMALEGNKVGACIGVSAVIMDTFYGKLNITKKYDKPKDECKC